jgi:hypothetical protein
MQLLLRPTDGSLRASRRCRFRELRDRARTLGVVAAVLTASHAGAMTHPAVSCSVADVQTAVAAATDGDTVVIPGGSCTWMSAVTISKGITLDAQGAVVTFGMGSGLTVSTDAVASAVVTGFTFNGGFKDGGYPIVINTTNTPFNLAFRFYNNTLNDDGSQGSITFIGVTGFGPGLVDHNTFTTTAGADEVVHLLGSGTPMDASGWSNDVMPGGPNMTFLENNVFVNDNPTYETSAEEAYYGAQLVFRYNHLTFEGNDIHQGGLAGRWAEVYDNTYEINGTAKGLANPLADYWQFRGGSGVVFDNIASEAPCCQDPYPGAQFGPDCPGSSDVCTGAWPIPTQVGTGIHETTNSPIYVWNNNATTDGSMQSIQSHLGYTNGTQAGPTPTSCTHFGNVCDVVATAAAPSSWVRCESAADVTAGCPVTYVYMPYVYPHPLDDLPTSCFGAGCVAQQPDGGAPTDAGAPPGDGAVATDSGVRDGGPSDGENSSSCSCGVPLEARSNVTSTVALGSAALLGALRRRRRRG